MNSDTSLIGASEEIKYENQSADKKKNIYVTPSKIVTEHKHKSNGRIVLLSKVSFIKKEQLTGADPTSRFLLIVAQILLSGFFLLVVSDYTDEFTTFTPLTIEIVLGVIFVMLPIIGAIKTFYSIKTKDWSAPKDEVWFNVRGPDGAIGLRLKELEVQKVIEAMEDGLPQDVRVID